MFFVREAETANRSTSTQIRITPSASCPSAGGTLARADQVGLVAELLSLFQREAGDELAGAHLHHAAVADRQGAPAVGPAQGQPQQGGEGALLALHLGVPRQRLATHLRRP